MNTSPSKLKDSLTLRRHTAYFGDTAAPKKANKTAAKKARTPKKKGPLVTETIQAPYHFTPEETVTMNSELRQQLQTVEDLEAQKKQSAQDFKLRIDTAENKIKQLRLRLDSGTETRALDARVEFDAKKRKKSFFNPITDEFIREEDMTPADFQLPMFKKEDIDPIAKKAPLTSVPEKAPAPPVKAGKGPKTSPPGVTNVGDALDKAAAAKEAKPLLLDRGIW